MNVWGSFFHGPPCPRASPGSTPAQAPGSPAGQASGGGRCAGQGWPPRSGIASVFALGAPGFSCRWRPPTKPAPILKLAPTRKARSPHGSQGVDGGDEGCRPPSLLTKDAPLQPLTAPAAHATSMGEGQSPSRGPRGEGRDLGLCTQYLSGVQNGQ